MLRSAITLSQKAYTCVCRVVWTKEAHVVGQRLLTTTSAWRTLDKDAAGKSDAYKKSVAERAYQEVDYDSGPTEQEIMHGLFSGGILTPNKQTPDMLVNGTRFADLPIVHIKSTHNNTIISLTTSQGAVVLLNSCGKEGFKNAKKGTNIAAQTTGLTLAKEALRKGIHDVRVVVKGLGPGRLPGMKGLQMAGMNVVSITDNTIVKWSGGKSRKRKRL